MAGQLLPENVIIELVPRVISILLKEGNIVHLSSPVTVVGDLHGQSYDLCEIFKISGPLPDTNYIFLGDYVDRGYYSLQVITLLALLKLLYPCRITLIRGNHESRSITQTYGFYAECVNKYGNTNVWTAFTTLFDFLVLGAVVDGELLCVHGGLSPSLHTLDQIRLIDRYKEIPHEGGMADLVWSDPDPTIKDFAISQRGISVELKLGAGYTFGERVTEQFCFSNSINHIARAHQLCMEGYQVLFNDLLSTVWSAPNYCYRAGNLASVLNISPGLKRSFVVFPACPDDLRVAPKDEKFRLDVHDVGEVINSSEPNDYFI